MSAQVPVAGSLPEATFAGDLNMCVAGSEGAAATTEARSFLDPGTSSLYERRFVMLALCGCPLTPVILRP
jgi:hypothetical protein